MIDLLPLEQNAVLTEINEELQTFGPQLIVSRGLAVDRAASVYELMTFIYAKFGKKDVPFGTVFEKIHYFVQQQVEIYNELRGESKKPWE